MKVWEATGQITGGNLFSLIKNCIRAQTEIRIWFLGAPGASLAPHSDKICDWRKSQWRTNGFSSVHHGVCPVLWFGHPNVMKQHAECVVCHKQQEDLEPKKRLLLGLQHLFCLLSLWAVQSEFKSRCLYTSRWEI